MPCPTRSIDGPMFGDIECSGNGICEEFLNRSLCRCSAGFTGGADLFDLRVEYDSVTGEYLALDCPSSVMGTQIIWGITLSVYLFVWIRGILVFFRSSSFGMKTLLQQCVAVEIFFTLPINILISGFKIGDVNTVFGTSMWQTILCMLTETSHTIVHLNISVLEFKVFGLQQSKRFQQILKRYKQTVYLELIAFILSSVLSPLIMLSLPKFQGPIINYQFVLLITRNIGTVQMVVVGYIAGHMNLERFKKAFNLHDDHHVDASSSSKDGQDSSGKSSSTERAKKTITFLIGQKKEYLSGAILLGIIYFIASLPWVWPYQTYFMGVMACIGHLGFNVTAMLEHKVKNDHLVRVNSKMENVNPSFRRNHREGSKTESKESLPISPFASTHGEQ